MSRKFPPFHPHRWFHNGHLQTIAGAYWPTSVPSLDTVVHRVLLDDDDTIIVHDDKGPHWRPGRPLVLLVHGLGGSHRSGYMERLAWQLQEQGLRVFRQDLRGFGAGFNTARQHTHAGRTEDTRQVLDYILRIAPNSPLTLVGFSMGGNIVLKLLGELGENTPPLVEKALAAAPPIDLLQCANNLRRGFNRIYDWSFASELCSLLQRRRRSVPGLVDRKVRPLPTCLYQFDDQFTSRVNGFGNAKEYYRRASSGPQLSSIRLPTLIISAADDPVVPVQMFDKWQRSGAVSLHITRHGGHLGYIGAPNGDPDRRWLDWRIVDWMMQSKV